jgi:hypothetical protein
MYNDQLNPETISIENLHLDPNNPRFWTEKIFRETPDSRVPNADVQLLTLERIESHGIDQLCDSILRNGFLPMDRIVVRALEGNPGQYVAVEGNRRLAALKILRQRIEDEVVEEDNIDDEYLTALVSRTNELEVLVYEGAETTDIAWLLQGIRHISGIRDWAPAQRARLVARQIDEEGMGFKQAGQQFGLSAQAVGRLYRSYKALEQMREDDEYQAKARNDYFTLFEEAIRNKSVRDWLEWSDTDSKFGNESNLTQFYSWITPDDDHTDQRRRIHDPKQIRLLGGLIAGEHKSLLDRVDNHDVSIETAHARALELGEKYDWKESLQNAAALIGNIPQSAIAESPDEILTSLNGLREQIDALTKMAEAVAGEQ